MPSHDPSMKLVEIVNDQLKQGKSETDIVALLVSSGLDSAKARQVVDTVKTARKGNLSGVIRFMLLVLAILSSLSCMFYVALGEQGFVGQTKVLTLIFFFCFILYGIIANIKGKGMVYARLVNSSFWLMSSFMLMVAMFLHPGWQNKWFGTGGGWRGQLVTIIGNLIYNIGAEGVAYTLLLTTFIILLLFWSEYHRLKIRDFNAI